MDFKVENNIVFENGRLICVGHELVRIPTVLARMHGNDVVCLDMSHNALISLNGLEAFSNLHELIVDGNSISESVLIPHLPNLTTFSLNKNKVKNLELFVQKLTASLPNLRYLSLLGNVACPDQLSDSSKDEEDYAIYRRYVLHHLPKLEFLDSAPVRRDELLEAKLRGHLLRIAKPLVQSEVEVGSPNVSSDLTPLPRSRRGIGDHTGAYGKCRYKYSGKHSEGNRFICNNDL